MKNWKSALLGFILIVLGVTLIISGNVNANSVSNPNDFPLETLY